MKMVKIYTRKADGYIDTGDDNEDGAYVVILTDSNHTYIISADGCESRDISGFKIDEDNDEKYTTSLSDSEVEDIAMFIDADYSVKNIDGNDIISIAGENSLEEAPAKTEFVVLNWHTHSCCGSGVLSSVVFCTTKKEADDTVEKWKQSGDFGVYGGNKESSILTCEKYEEYRETANMDNITCRQCNKEKCEYVTYDDFSCSENDDDEEQE